VGRLLAALGVTMAVVAGADAPVTEFLNLFDGKTLDGWTAEHTNRFSVRNGVIVNDGGTGWLRSNRIFKDFELRAEYRSLKSGGDSGLFFRSTAESTPRNPHWPLKGYQLQVIDADSNFQIFGHGTPPPKSDRKTSALKKAMKPHGQWQSITLRVVGTHAEADLDGTPITVSDAITRPEGHIGLQGENSLFEWRNLKIKQLPAQ
jgi:hypothetical protein